MTKKGAKHSLPLYASRKPDKTGNNFSDIGSQIVQDCYSLRREKHRGEFYVHLSVLLTRTIWTVTQRRVLKQHMAVLLSQKETDQS
jgi:hypothetical protein